MIKLLRRLKDGTHAQELPHPVDLTIHTKCPEKWILVDQQTGQVYRGSSEPTQYGPWEWINMPNDEDKFYEARNERLIKIISRIKEEDKELLELLARLED